MAKQIFNTSTPKVVYLTNKDILKQIHLSKNTYCSFLDPVNDHQYDIILPSVAKINQRTVAEARRNRADRIKKETGVVVDPKKIPNTDLVFRVTCWEHIPMAPKKIPKSAQTKKKKLEDIFDFGIAEDAVIDLPEENELSIKYVRLPFPPFYHYRIDENKIPFIVGKSHWRGDLETGEFDKDHGEMTRTLATMFIKLCDRYATRSNWRGYCVDEATEALTDKGWVSIDDINENNKILSYNGSNLAWSSIRSIYRGEFNGLMHKLTMRGYDSLITPNHKIVTKRGLVPVELLKENDQMILSADAEEGVKESIYSNDFVELAGWIVTEGCYEIERNVESKLGNIKRITVYQNAGAKADRIKNCLNNLGYKFSEGVRGKNLCFSISRNDCKKIIQILPEKNLSMKFILSLTLKQRELLIETMIDGDGWRRSNGNRSYVQKDKHHVDLFQALCVLSGVRSNTHLVDSISFGKPSACYAVNLFSKKSNIAKVSSVNLHGGKRNGRKRIGAGKITHPNEPTTYYKGRVWCPETEYGCFVARRNGTVYLTGNTYNEEMRGAALVQLSQIGLRFDESKSQNPFAYYTAAVTNSFTHVLNSEKKNQNIRDDLLEIHGLNPSWTRQNSGGKDHNKDSEVIITYGDQPV